MRACAVGDNTIDIYPGTRMGTFVGGNALNVAVNLRHSGADVTYFGGVGDDAEGRLILDTLREVGVSTTGLRLLGESTASTRVHLDAGGERTFVSENYGASGTYQPNESDLALIAEFDVVHIGMLYDSVAVRRHLFGRVGQLSQDCAVTPGRDHLDVAFLSAGADADRANDLAREAVAAGARIAVVTRGAEGSIATDGTTWYQTPAEKIEPVDTTGAGDSYAAAFLFAYRNCSDIPAAMQAASMAAAKTCTHLGAWLK
jgi:fructoselysine 6-kinase